MHRVNVFGVVNTCDAGRGGELIFRLVYEAAGCKKPMRRLWISSMEDGAVKADFASFKDGQEYDALFAFALCRAKADWPIGTNVTRLFSCLYGKTLNVEYVQTPTLRMFTDRDAAIPHFQKEKYYRARPDLSGAETANGRVPDKAEADAPKGVCGAETAIYVPLTREKRIAAPPKFPDLISLQREANRIFGYTVKQTFDLAQSLYKRRLLAYPRADSSLLTDDMGGTATSIIALLYERLPSMADTNFTPEVVKVLGSKRVLDHHAIIPIMEFAKADSDTLPESKKSILTLAGVRLLFATAEPHIYEVVTAAFSCAGTGFTAGGKTVLAEGWEELQRRYRTMPKDKPEAEDGENTDMTLPKLFEGQGFSNSAAKVTEHTTTPPKSHSETSLLSAMECAGNGDADPDAERRGLGIPATRAAVIERLVKDNFVECKGKQFTPTENGSSLIYILPDMLTSPQLTAERGNNLTQIAKETADSDEFLSGIEAMAWEFVQTHTAAPDGKKDLSRKEKSSVGKCPHYGFSVHKGKKNCYCSNKECAFIMWKNDRFFEKRKTALSTKIATAFFKPDKANVKGFYSPKTGRTYDGATVLADTGGKYVNYHIEVWKN